MSPRSVLSRIIPRCYANDRLLLPTRLLGMHSEAGEGELARTPARHQESRTLRHAPSAAWLRVRLGLSKAACCAQQADRSFAAMATD
jgi:hypothetical protein